MKRYSLLFLMCLYVGILNAQLVNQDDQTAKKQSDLDWYNCSFDKAGVYGAEVNKAYEFLKGKKYKIKISFLLLSLSPPGLFLLANPDQQSALLYRLKR